MVGDGLIIAMPKTAMKHRPSLMKNKDLFFLVGGGDSHAGRTLKNGISYAGVSPAFIKICVFTLSPYVARAFVENVYKYVYKYVYALHLISIGVSRIRGNAMVWRLLSDSSKSKKKSVSSRGSARGDPATRKLKYQVAISYPR